MSLGIAVRTLLAILGKQRLRIAVPSRRLAIVEPVLRQRSAVGLEGVGDRGVRDFPDVHAEGTGQLRGDLSGFAVADAVDSYHGGPRVRPACRRVLVVQVATGCRVERAGRPYAQQRVCRRLGRDRAAGIVAEVGQ